MKQSEGVRWRGARCRFWDPRSPDYSWFWGVRGHRHALLGVEPQPGLEGMLGQALLGYPAL